MKLGILINELNEAFSIAWSQIRSHKVRSSLTALGVIIGIIAVTLMGTAIKGINTGFEDSLDLLGSDVIYIERWPWKDVGDNWTLYRGRPHLQLEFANVINDYIRSNPESYLQIAAPAAGRNRPIHKDDRTTRGIYILGTSADYSVINPAKIEVGRYFTYAEELSGQNVVVLGYDVAESLFGSVSDLVINDTVDIQGRKFTVAGVLEKQGSFLGLQSMDQQAVIPLASLRKFFRWDGNNSLRIKIKDEDFMNEAADEITGLMRRLRSLDPLEGNDFEVNRSEALAEQFGPVKKGITIAGFFITGLALFVGAIGIMNITFVSVKERTKEIGTRRAIGAPRRAILIQFLVESVLICFLGGLVGIAVAFGIKEIISTWVPLFPFVLSFNLVIFGCTLSIFTGIASGLAPAWQAAQLDPSEALRHE